MIDAIKVAKNSTLIGSFSIEFKEKINSSSNNKSNNSSSNNNNSNNSKIKLDYTRIFTFCQNLFHSINHRFVCLFSSSIVALEASICVEE
jgi:hypothetical protein